jgi:hypothetical protein
MNLSARRVCLVAVAVVVCVALSPRGAAAQEDEAFKQGLSARNDKKWPAAAEAMRRAIQADGKESTRKVRRSLLGGSTEYLPYFFLGEALKNQGDCAGAVTAWSSSEEQKVVLTVREFATLMRAGLAECAAKGVLLNPEYRQQLDATDQAYRDAYTVAERVTKVRASHPDLWRPDVDAEYERVRGELQTAQQRLVRGKESRQAADFNESKSATARATAILRPLEEKLSAAINSRAAFQGQSKETAQLIAGAESTDRAIDAARLTLPPLLAQSRDGGRALLGRARERLGAAEKTQNAGAAEEAFKLAQDASSALTAVLDQVNKLAREAVKQRLQEAVAAATQELSFLASSFATLERLAAEKPDKMQPAMATERSSLQKEQTTLQRRFENARRTENVTGVQDLTRAAADVRLRLDALIKAFGPASLRDRGVNPGLEEGARLYFGGEYQRALDSLNGVGSEVPLQLHVHLFRAAALYALYVHSGETDAALRDRARAEVDECRKIDPSFQPNSRAFSPRFISFFQGQ